MREPGGINLDASLSAIEAVNDGLGDEGTRPVQPDALDPDVVGVKNGESDCRAVNEEERSVAAHGDVREPDERQLHGVRVCLVVVGDVKRKRRSRLGAEDVLALFEVNSAAARVPDTFDRGKVGCGGVFRSGTYFHGRKLSGAQTTGGKRNRNAANRQRHGFHTAELYHIRILTINRRWRREGDLNPRYGD